MDIDLSASFRQLLDKYGESSMLTAIRKVTTRAPSETDLSYTKRQNGLVLVVCSYLKTRRGPKEERKKVAYCIGYNATNIFEATVFGQPSSSRMLQRRLARVLLSECVMHGMLNNDDPQASSWLFLRDEFSRVCTYISKNTGDELQRIKLRLLEYLMST
jgi:hypothetical protein